MKWVMDSLPLAGEGTGVRERWWIVVIFLCLLSLPCLGLTAIGAERLDLFHAAFHNACTVNTYALHWQNPRRLKQDLRYDFFLSSDSLVMVEIWLAGAPTVSWTWVVPLACPRI